MTTDRDSSAVGIETASAKPDRPVSPFRHAVFRGLAFIMPPLLTLVLFLWAGSIISNNIVQPIESVARHVIVWVRGDLRDHRWVEKQLAENPERTAMLEPVDGRPIFARQIPQRNLLIQEQWIRVGRSWIRKQVYDAVEEDPGRLPPVTTESYVHRYAELRYLRPQFTIPLFIALFILVLYLLGKFVAGGVGRMIWSAFESMVNRIPVISNVYSSVKQVTDFALSEREIQFTRVVAVEYPRRGSWSLGFATGDSMEPIRVTAGEALVSVFVPTSPMPMTGFTISVPRSQVLDLNLSVDQAIQFVVSCGVVVAPHLQSQPADLTNDSPGTQASPTSVPAIGTSTDEQPASPSDSKPRK